MNVQALSSDAKFTNAIDYTAAGTSTLTATIDMAGYDGVAFVASAAVADAGNFIKASHGDLSDGSDKVDLEGSKVEFPANNKIAVLDIYRPARDTVGPRYVTVSVVRGTSTAIGGVIAIRYHSAFKPQTNKVSGQVEFKLLTSPTEGTA